MTTLLKCLLVLVLTYLLMVALSGVGLALGSLEIAVLAVLAVVVMVVIVRGDRRRDTHPRP